MTIPTFHISISGNLVAAYAAIVSTVALANQIFVHYRDKANIKIRVQPGMRTYGDEGESDQFTLVTVLNAGRRPVTITSLGAAGLHPHHSFVVNRTRPELMCELTECKPLQAMIDEEDEYFDLEYVAYWFAMDGTGKEYHKNIAPWYKRYQSKRRVHRDAKRRAKLTISV